MMKYILTFFLMSSFLLADTKYNYKVLRVVDGDTVEIQVNFLPSELGNKLKLRVYGVDTPEKGFRARNLYEKKLGENASLFTKSMIESAKNISVTIKSWDKYGGRVLGDVIIDGKSLRNELIKNGFAREYYGNAKMTWDGWISNN